MFFFCSGFPLELLIPKKYIVFSRVYSKVGFTASTLGSIHFYVSQGPF